MAASSRKIMLSCLRRRLALNILCRIFWNSKLDLKNDKRVSRYHTSVRDEYHNIEQPLYRFSQFDNIFYLNVICRKYSSPSI